MITLMLVWLLNIGHAAEFAKLGDAIAAALGTTKAFQKKLGSETLYFSKDPNGQPQTYAVIERGVYEPNCTHTWVIGLKAKDRTVSSIRVVEMSCPHAFPTKSASFLDQFQGKGPKDLAELSSSIVTIAKATGSSNLTTDAVVRSIEKVGKLNQPVRSSP